jgi:UDP-N-acetylenolpyruvoylglucosamine reductase
MNAGANQSWTFNVAEHIRFMSPAGAVIEQPAAEVPATYRDCPTLHTHVALAAVFRGRPATEAEVRERMEAFSRRRWESQPREPSAGCIFKNPPGIPAGRLVDELGLKGTQVGGARVSEVHANFLVNTGAANARDLLDLIALIRRRAQTERGIELEPEVEIIGEEALGGRSDA